MTTATEEKKPKKRRYGAGNVYARKEEGSSAESWYCRYYTPRGQRVHRKLGPKRGPGRADGLTVRQAEAKLRELMDREASPVRTDRIGFEDAATRALDHFTTRPKRPLERRTAATYLSSINTHLVPRWRDRSVVEIEPADVERLISDMAAEGKADKTILNVYALASQIFDYAVSQRWRSDNPCAAVEAPTAPEREEIAFLSPAEVKALLAAVDLSDEYGSTDRALYATAAKCGLRQGELLALRWRHVDWSAERIRVRLNHDRKDDKKPKSKAGVRAVPLPASVAAELKRHRRKSDYTTAGDRVFCHPATGNVLDHSALVRRFKAALRSADLDAIRFHDLRHTYGTRLAAAGVDLVKIKTWMGHKDIATTMIYAHYAPGEDEAATVETAFALD